MEKNLFNNLENNNLDKRLKLEEDCLDKNSEEVSNLLAEKGSFVTEKAKALKKRLGVLLKPFTAFSEKTLLQQQASQQKKVEEHFGKDSSVEISSFYNNADGSGALDIKEELKKAGVNNNKIILLLNGIVNPQDIVQGLSPHVARLFMALLRLQSNRYGLDVKKLSKGDSIPDYVINTTKEVQSELFENKPVKVLVVRNASSKDLLDVVQVGEENTVLVVGGHGTFSSLRMTDKSVSSEDIPDPEKRLKAFVQHTCAVNKGGEEIGSRFAQKTFGWTRGTSPLDFIEEPLHPRSTFSEESQ